MEQASEWKTKLSKGFWNRKNKSKIAKNRKNIGICVSRNLHKFVWGEKKNKYVKSNKTPLIL